MKKTTFTSLLIVSTAILFTACSTKEGPKKKAQSVESIIALQQVEIATLPMAQTYPMERRISYTPPTPYQYRRDYTVPRVNPLVISNKIEWDAKKLLGKTYVWGATGPSTYDCSGFTQKVYRDVGINIPRVSRDQARVGQFVDYAHLRKGDMVFFDTKKRRTGKVCHVGIYLGQGNFIHASSGAKKIVIYNFNQKKFYKNRFLWGRRVINTNVRLASL